MATTTCTTRELEDLLEALATHREFLRFTVRDLAEADARRHPTASELSLGGLIKHVASTERQWARFIQIGAAAMGSFAEWSDDQWDEGDPAVQEWASAFQLDADETLAGVLEEYAAVAEQTAAILRGETDLDREIPLPEAPWFQSTAWSVRRVALHILAETAQHAGHADILRESIDGQRTMG